MKFNYRDFFITNNDDLNIIKEELSIVDEVTSRENALVPNAKAVWDMYKKETSGTDGSSGSSGSSGTSGTDGSSGSNEPKIEQKIADKLKINLSTVQKIIQICLMNTEDKKNPPTIARELGISDTTVKDTLNYALGSEWKRKIDLHFTKDAEKIYNLKKLGKTEDEIVKLINQNRKSYLQIKLNKVELVLKIVDIATKQMDDDGEVNVEKIYREIGKKISLATINNLIKKLNLGKLQYHHKFTEEQDAFILYYYLQETPNEEIARKFNEKFSTESNKLKITGAGIRQRLINKLNLKDKGESEISQKVLDLLNKYETKYFSKEKLTRYIPPERIKGRDRLARQGGKVNPTRQISGQFGNLEPDTHQTFTTGETPASGQLGKRHGAPMNPQGAIGSL